MSESTAELRVLSWFVRPHRQLEGQIKYPRSQSSSLWVSEMMLAPFFVYIGAVVVLETGLDFGSWFDCASASLRPLTKGATDRGLRLEWSVVAAGTLRGRLIHMNVGGLSNGLLATSRYQEIS